MKWERFKGLLKMTPKATTPIVDAASLIRALKDKNYTIGKFKNSEFYIKKYESKRSRA